MFGNELHISGPLSFGNYKINGGVSSQFVSGLLFALSLCEGESIIELTGNIESKSYIDMTLDAMALFGVKAHWQNENTLFVSGNQTYKATDITNEGDWSNAAFLDAFNVLGGDVKVTGLCESSKQGDKVYRDYFSLIRQGTPTLDIKNCPDLAPVLMATAAALNGVHLVNTDRLKIKESDRGAAMAEELSKLGVKVVLGDTEITVEAPSALTPPTVPLNGHNDHRIVMALAVLLSLVGGEIEGAEAVNKSYPDFFENLMSLGIRVTYVNE